MEVRRCSVLFVELDETPRFEISSLLAGGDGLERSARWLAHAGHLPQPVPLGPRELEALACISADRFVALEDLKSLHGAALVERLLDLRLLLSGEDGSAEGERDRNARSVPWWPQALLAHGSGGWQDVDIQARHQAGMMPNSAQQVENNGPPPSHDYRRRPGETVLALQAPGRSDFDDLLSRRRTCRNFDGSTQVPAAALATMLHRVWGAIGTKTLAPGAVAVKKTSPAGGGLHAVEAYVLVQRVEGMAPGLYHYLPMQHALEPMRELSAADAASLAHRFVAGQQWFANAPVMIVMTARFDRLFWKYRRHAKAWRVVHLDVGHLSQTLYLSAADLGLGAFVTAAINDREIDQALALAPLREGTIAVVGFGARAEAITTPEMEPLVPTPAALLASR